MEVDISDRFFSCGQNSRSLIWFPAYLDNPSWIDVVFVLELPGPKDCFKACPSGKRKSRIDFKILYFGKESEQPLCSFQMKNMFLTQS